MIDPKNIYKDTHIIGAGNAVFSLYEGEIFVPKLHFLIVKGVELDTGFDSYCIETGFCSYSKHSVKDVVCQLVSYCVDYLRHKVCTQSDVYEFLNNLQGITNDQHWHAYRVCLVDMQVNRKIVKSLSEDIKEFIEKKINNLKPLRLESLKFDSFYY